MMHSPCVPFSDLLGGIQNAFPIMQHLRNLSVHSSESLLAFAGRMKPRNFSTAWNIYSLLAPPLHCLILYWQQSLQMLQIMASVQRWPRVMALLKEQLLLHLEHRQMYSTTENEALACTWVTEKWRTYLWGSHFTLCTDYSPLSTLLSTRVLDVQAWYLLDLLVF